MPNDAPAPPPGKPPATPLKPCPFCGRPPTQSDRASGEVPGRRVYFVACYCGGYGAKAHQIGATAEEVADRWNGRPAEVPDPWNRVTEDDASLPPVRESVVLWNHAGKPDFGHWSGRDWDFPGGRSLMPRAYVLAWQRVAGPGWLAREG